ncbi:MAG TPA: glucodextranase DOMON-like domain-containing protein [Thermoanaerobaculia bacterium]|nr:glucodextranase DOMON-like domain-containing protein [Thermoanaerobaculia bacterium]
MTHRTPTPASVFAAGIALLALVALTPAPTPAAAAEQPLLFQLDDPRGDDHGDGTLLYPANDDYVRGDLDLVSFAARRGDGGTWFEATFARPIRKPDARAIDGLGTPLQSVAQLGFFTFNIDVYIDRDRQPGSGGVVALPGRKARIAPDHAWDRAVVLTPQPHAARGELKRLLVRALEEELDLDEPGLELAQAVEMRHRIPMDVEDRVFFPTRVRVRGQKVSFFVPDRFLGAPASPEWSYVVAVSGADLLQSFELTGRLGLSAADEDGLMILPVTSGRPRDHFGGRERAPLQPPLVDILVPPGTTQEEVLQSYDLAEGLPVELPGVVPAEVGTE